MADRDDEARHFLARRIPGVTSGPVRRMALLFPLVLAVRALAGELFSSRLAGLHGAWSWGWLPARGRPVDRVTRPGPT